MPLYHRRHGFKLLYEYFPFGYKYIFNVEKIFNYPLNAYLVVLQKLYIRFLKHQPSVHIYDLIKIKNILYSKISLFYLFSFSLPQIHKIWCFSLFWTLPLWGFTWGVVFMLFPLLENFGKSKIICFKVLTFWQ